MLSARSSRRAAALLAALVGWAFLAGPASAADPAAPDTSLKLVPADAAFYSTMLRNKEQLDLVANSRAWAKLWAMPSVQQAWKIVQDQYNTPTGSLSTLRQLMQTEENKDLVALFGDAFSDEVFCYGDDGWADLFDLYQETYAGMQYQPLLDQLNHKPGDGPSQENPIRPILSALAKNPDKIKVPNLVIGFKVSDAQRAEKQIRRLEQFAAAAGRPVPRLQGAGEADQGRRRQLPHAVSGRLANPVGRHPLEADRGKTRRACPGHRQVEVADADHQPGRGSRLPDRRHRPLDRVPVHVRRPRPAPGRTAGVQAAGQVRGSEADLDRLLQQGVPAEGGRQRRPARWTR